MEVTFDLPKNERNIHQKRLSFDRAADFDFQSAISSVDARRDYGEVRRVALGYLDYRLHVLCFTDTAEGIRVISFRKAKAIEVRRYEAAQTADR